MKWNKIVKICRSHYLGEEKEKHIWGWYINNKRLYKKWIKRRGKKEKRKQNKYYND